MSPDSVQPADAAYQGVPGAFSEQAARNALASTPGRALRLLGCPSFEELFDAVESRRARYGVVPVENSLAGRVERCWDLLASRRVDVIGESSLRIRHTLIAAPGATVEGLRRVRSHPVALRQCLRFFADHPMIEAIESFDTAGAVAEVLASGSLDVGAIASRLAAEVYGGSILAEDLEDSPDNVTRFVLVRAKGAA